MAGGDKYQIAFSELQSYFDTNGVLLDSDDSELTLEVNIDSLHKLIEYVDVIGNSIEIGKSLIYRGISNTEHGLVPSIMRDNIFSNGDLSAKSIDALEKKLLTEFKKQARPYLQLLPREEKWDWEWLALAQHHFLPTRLLDWTERAGTALFFAVEKKGIADKDDKDAFVWAIMAPKHITEDREHKPSSIEGVGLYRPPHIVPRITMQQGCFTVHPSNYMDGVMKWIKGPKIKFRITSSNKEIVRRGLYAAGVNRAALFPGLDGIAKHLTETVDNYIKQKKT